MYSLFEYLKIYYLQIKFSFCITLNDVGYVVLTTRTAVPPGLTEANFHMEHYKK